MFQQSSEQILNDFSKYRSAVMGVYILSIALFHQHFLHSFPWNIFHYYGYWGSGRNTHLSTKNGISPDYSHSFSCKDSNNS